MYVFFGINRVPDCPYVRVRFDSIIFLGQDNQVKLFKEIVQFSPEVLQNGQGSGLGLWSESSITVHPHRLPISLLLSAYLPW